MKNKKFPELGLMLETWRHRMHSNGRTLTQRELCQLAPMSPHTFLKVKKGSLRT